MKLRYSITLLTLLFTACTKEPNNTTIGDSNSVTFSVTLDGVSPVETRAIDDMSFKTYGFYIAGYYTNNLFEENLNDVENYPFPNVFDKSGETSAIPVPLVREDEKQEYRLPIPNLELSDDTYLSFFAWGQNKAEDISSGIVNKTRTAQDKGYPWLDIRIDNAPLSQCDIVASKHMNHKNDYVVSAVDLPFSHILSKLTFRTKSSTNCSVQFTKVSLKYGTNKVYRYGRFTFDETDQLGKYGTLSAFHSGEYTLLNSMPAAGKELSLGEITLLPQKVTDGFITLELKYKIKVSPTVEAIEQTRSVSLKAADLKKGNNYIYTLDITADEIRIADSRIAPWKDDTSVSGLPLIAGPRGNVLLLLEGNEAPYTASNGDRYWLDHSGYNRHCKIVDTKITYDSKTKGYYFPNTSTTIQGMTIPELGSFGSNDGLTLDIIASTTTASSSQVPFLLSRVNASSLANADGERRQFFSHLGISTSSSVYFDCGGKSSTPFEVSRMHIPFSSTSFVRNLSMFTYRFKTNSHQSVTRNGSFTVIQSVLKGTDYYLGDLKYNALGADFQGTIKYVQIRKEIVSEATTSAEFATLKTKYNIPDNEGMPKNQSSGLVLNLDGTKNIVSGQWQDQSGNGHHARVNGTIDFLNPGYNFNGNSNNYFKLIDGLGTLPTYTLEYVAHHKESNGQLMFFGNDNTGIMNRGIVIYYFGTSQFTIYSPWGYEYYGSSELSVKPIDRVNTQWCVTRTSGANGLTAYKNKQQAGITNCIPEIPPLTYCYIGRQPDGGYAFNGVIYTIRIYNRIISKEEREYNYAIDKMKYPDLK